MIEEVSFIHKTVALVGRKIRMKGMCNVSCIHFPQAKMQVFFNELAQYKQPSFTGSSTYSLGT
jgi:hypothetical protein